MACTTAAAHYDAAEASEFGWENLAAAAAAATRTAAALSDPEVPDA